MEVCMTNLQLGALFAIGGVTLATLALCAVWGVYILAEAIRR